MANYSSTSFPWYSVRNNIYSLVVDNGVTTIGDNAFYGCTNLETVTFGNDVNTIGSYAFYGCANLCASGTIRFPEALTTISTYAFYGCNQFYYVSFSGSNLIWLDDYAFYGCAKLQNASLPYSVSRIGNHAFRGCSWLYQVNGNATIIGDYAFFNCGNLSYANLGSNVTNIGDYAFTACYNLSNFDMSSLTTLGNEAFSNCTRLASVILPNSLTSMGNNAFKGCTSLTSVLIGTGITTISQSAFEGCSNLVAVTLPSSVAAVGNNAFQNCSKLRLLTVSRTTPPTLGSNALSGVYSGFCVSVPSNLYNTYKTNSSWGSLVCASGSYAVNFNPMGGSPTPTAQLVNSGGRVAEPPAPTRSSYTFGGWYTSTSYTTQWNFATSTVTAPITLYAKWSCTVTFNAQSGSPTPPTQTVAVGGKATTPNPAPTRVGYTLAGWYTSTAYTTQWNFSTSTVTANTTLYARWSCTVTFDAQGGSPTPPTQSVTAGSKATQPPTNPTRAGYTFAGWYTSTSYSIQWNFNSNVTANMTLYARWTANAYTIAYSANGGSGTTMTTTPCTYGSSCVLGANSYVRTNYAFAGWATSQANANSGNVAYANVQSVSNLTTTAGATVTLYAAWSYTITYHGNGGSGSMATTDCFYGVSCALRQNSFARENFLFRDWNRGQSGTSTSYANGASVSNLGNITLYAQWKNELFTVTFNTKGGAAVGVQRVTASQLATAPPPPTHPQYTFGGWYRDECLDENGEQPYSFSTPITEDIVLYAKWE